MTLTMEGSLLVSDFYRGDRGCAFEDASLASDEAARVALLELRDALGFKRRPPRLVVESVEFIEFDSGNLSHAGAHFEVKIAGLTDEEHARAAAMQERGDL